MNTRNQQKLKIIVPVMICILVFSFGFTSIVYGDLGGNGNLGVGANLGGNGSNADCPPGTLCNPLQVNSIGDAINKGVEIFSYIAILVAVIMIIYVGLKFIFAQGKPEKLKEAGRWLGYIVIGVAIILGARLMISIVINTLQATNVVDPKVINSANSVINR